MCFLLICVLKTIESDLAVPLNQPRNNFHNHSGEERGETYACKWLTLSPLSLQVNCTHSQKARGIINLLTPEFWLRFPKVTSCTRSAHGKGNQRWPVCWGLRKTGPWSRASSDQRPAAASCATQTAANTATAAPRPPRAFWRTSVLNSSHWPPLLSHAKA